MHSKISNRWAWVHTIIFLLGQNMRHSLSWCMLAILGSTFNMASFWEMWNEWKTSCRMATLRCIFIENSRCLRLWVVGHNVVDHLKCIENSSHKAPRCLVRQNLETMVHSPLCWPLFWFFIHRFPALLLLPNLCLVSFNFSLSATFSGKLLSCYCHCY